MSLRFPALVATLAAISSASVYAADEYQWEVAGSFTSSTEDTTPDETVLTVMQVEGTYHVFGPVALATHPYEEASFLEHSTSVSAQLAHVALEVGTVEPDGFAFGVSGRYAEKDVPVAIDLSITSIDLSDTGVDISVLEWELRAGYWLMPSMIAGLGYNSSTTESTGSADETSTEIFAYGKWVTELKADLDLNLEATLGQNSFDDGTNDDSNIAITVGGDVYFQKKYGIGLNLGTESGDVDANEGTTVGIDASAWFNPQIGVRASYETFMIGDDATGDDADVFGLEVVGRF